MTARRAAQVPATKARAAAALALSAALAAAIVALSGPVAGSPAPWDAEGPYYVLALALGGAVAGAILPAHPEFHYCGAVLGQAACDLLFLPSQPLLAIGLLFLLGYSAIFLFAQVAAAALRKRLGVGA